LKTVIVVSADGEWAAVESILSTASRASSPFGACLDVTLDGFPVKFMHGGWGKVAAAASAQYAIDRWHPKLLVNLGTCGGFEGRIEVGTIILVERTLMYDIVEQMTDGEGAVEHYATDIDLSWLSEAPPGAVQRGLLVSADRDIIGDEVPILISRYDAVAADWESAAIAWVAARHGQRLLILRGVTDLVGQSGGEAYGDYNLFLDRARATMQRLIGDLPAWLRASAAADQSWQVPTT
jgi:adenosylhomocysteine nucleosidase